MKAIAAKVRSKHGSNQAIGYVAGVFFPPLALALDDSPEDKAAYNRLQRRRDRLIVLARAKSCRFK